MTKTDALLSDVLRAHHRVVDCAHDVGYRLGSLPTDAPTATVDRFRRARADSHEARKDFADAYKRLHQHILSIQFSIKEDDT